MTGLAPLARRLANPFAGLDLVPGIVRCRLDALAQRNSGAAMERVFGASRAVHALVRAFQSYLNDAEAELALKKAFQIALEQRMRILALHADPTEDNGFGAIPLPALRHPLDPVARDAFDELDPRPRNLPIRVSLGDRLALFAALLTNAMSLLALVAGIGLGRGRPPSAPRRHVTVAAPVFANAQYWHTLCRGVVESSAWHKDAIGIFGLVKGSLEGYDGDGLLVEDPWTMPVDRRSWWQRVVRPTVHLVARAVGRALVRAHDAQVTQVASDALVLARQALPLRRLLKNNRVDFLLNVDEYTASHIVHGILLRAAGGRLVRWPHSQVDSPGATLELLGYDLFLNGGPYLAETYGETWRPACRRESVGLIKNDRRFRGSLLVAPAYAAAVEKACAAGQRIAVLFGAGNQQGNEPMVRENARAALEAFAGRKDWLLIVKAKGHKGQQHFMAVVEAEDDLRQHMAASNVVVVRYDCSEQEACPPGWLIQVMDLAVGMGSVQIEAVTQDKQCLWYMPVFHDTSCNRALEEAGMLFREPLGLNRALRDHAGSPCVPPVPGDWFRRALDPFGDDQAIARLADLLWQAPADVPRQERAPARNVP